MNNLAVELNKTIEGTSAFDLLSGLGKRLYFPKGIVAQSAEAKLNATLFNATVGMAISGGHAVELPSMKKLLPELTPEEAVTYAPTGGDASLNRLWKEQMLLKNPGLKPGNCSTPVVVPGLTSGICQLMDLFIDKDEAVVVPDMFWGNYRLMIEERREARIASFPFFNSNGGLNIEGFRETIKASTVNGKAAVILNFPNNPTGYSPTKDEAKLLAEMLTGIAEEGTRILAIMDDAYFGLFFEEDTFKESLFSVLADAHENILAVKVDGATKEHFVWGFRIGFVTFGSKGLTEAQYKALETKLSAGIRSTVSNSSKPAQSLLLKAMQDPSYNDEKLHYESELNERYLRIKEILKNMPEDSILEPLPFNSGYFMSFVLKSGSAEALRLKLLNEDGIGTISIQDKYLRVAFSSVDIENIDELYERIFKAAAAL